MNTPLEQLVAFCRDIYRLDPLVNGRLDHMLGSLMPPSLWCMGELYLFRHSPLGWSEEYSWRQLLGAGALAGIGFTISL